MRRILNLFITGFILWMASKMAPEQVQIKDFGTLALATVSLWLVTIMIYVNGGNKNPCLICHR